MNYVRSLTSLRDKCNFGSADQMNQATHFLDGSMIYGSSASKAASLRFMKKGKLTSTLKNNDELLPMSDTPEGSCQSEGEEVCFKSGDSRVNMHPHQSAHYTIWVREHNRIANLNKLKLVYNHPDDVDLIVGAISETPSAGSPLGPVFQCIIREQMMRTRAGDRFFYQLGGKPHSFKEGQINEIKKMTLSRIFCDNVKNLQMMQLDVFSVPSEKNPLVNFSDVTRIPRMNLSFWKSR